MLSVAMLTAGSIVILALVVFGRSHTVKAPAPQLRNADQRTPAVPFDATTTAGQRVSLAAFKGRPLVINFFAAWCDPCRREAAAFVQLDHRFAGRVNLLSVAVRTPQLSSVRGFVHDHDMSWPVVWDEHGHLIDPYHVLGQPITYIIDAQGRVVYRIIGETTEQRVGGVLDRLLA